LLGICRLGGHDDTTLGITVDAHHVIPGPDFPGVPQYTVHLDPPFPVSRSLIVNVTTPVPCVTEVGGSFAAPAVADVPLLAEFAAVGVPPDRTIRPAQ